MARSAIPESWLYRASVNHSRPLPPPPHCCQDVLVPGDLQAYFDMIKSLIEQNISNFITKEELRDSMTGLSTEVEQLKQLFNNYTLPVATDRRLGGVIIGDNLYITQDGILSSDTPRWEEISSLHR